MKMSGEIQKESKARKKRRPQGAKSGKSRDFSKAKLSAKYRQEHKEIPRVDGCTKNENIRLEKGLPEGDFSSLCIPGVEKPLQRKHFRLARGNRYREIKGSHTEDLQTTWQTPRQENLQTQETFVSREDHDSTFEISIIDECQSSQEAVSTSSYYDDANAGWIPGQQCDEKLYRMPGRKSYDCDCHPISQNPGRKSPYTNPLQPVRAKPAVKSAWQLDHRFKITKDFPTEVIEDDVNLGIPQTLQNNSNLKQKSLLPILVGQNSEDNVVHRECNFGYLSSAKPKPDFVLSGKTCKIKLPNSFPGILSQPTTTIEPNEPVNEEASRFTNVKLETPQELQNQTSKTRQLKETSSEPSSPTSELLNPPQSPQISSSTEFTAARVVGELCSVFNETLRETPDERPSCITPNTMPKRYSVSSSRRRTATPFNNDLGSEASFPHSRSMPNLHAHTVQAAPKRIFVTFEEHRPRACAVDLKAESEIAEKCRNLDLSLDSLGIANLKEKRVHKNILIKRWIKSCGHYVPNRTEGMSVRRCTACRVHEQCEGHHNIYRSAPPKTSNMS